MTFHRRCGFCIALLLTAPAALGQEALVLIPRAPAKCKPFKVALPLASLEAEEPGASQSQYVWKVTDAETGQPFAGDAGIELTNGGIETPKPALAVKTPLPRKYRFEVRRKGAEEDEPSVLHVDAALDPVQAFSVETEGATGAPAAGASQPPVGESAPPTAPSQPPPPVSASPGAAPSPAAPPVVNWPAPFEVEPGSSQEAIAERLGDARAWWNANVIKQFNGTPSISEDFIRLKLTDDDKSEFNLKDQIQTPLIAAARFYRAAYRAAANPATAEEVWKLERESLLKQIEEDDQETELSLQLIRNFLEALEAEIRLKAPNRFGAALREAAMTIGKLLLQKVEQDIVSLVDGSGPPGTGQRAGTGTFTTDGFYGTSHAAVHHARAMARIRMRSARRLARIQGY